GRGVPRPRHPPALLHGVVGVGAGGRPRFPPSCDCSSAMTARGRRLANADLPLIGLRASRLALLGFLAVGAIAAWRWRTLLDPAAISATIASYPIAPLGFLAVHIAASLLFVPRTLLAIVAGL